MPTEAELRLRSLTLETKVKRKARKRNGHKKEIPAYKTTPMYLTHLAKTMSVQCDEFEHQENRIKMLELADQVGKSQKNVLERKGSDKSIKRKGSDKSLKGNSNKNEQLIPLTRNSGISSLTGQNIRPDNSYANMIIEENDDIDSL